MALIQCKFCGRSFDTALGLSKCNLCGAALPQSNVPQDEEPRRPTWSSNYKAAHIPAHSETNEPTCPWCGKRLMMREGCEQCSCGYSACG